MKRYLLASAIVLVAYGLGSSDPSVGQSTGTPELTTTIIDRTDTVYDPRRDDNTADVGKDVREDILREESWTPSEKHRRSEEMLAGMIFGECRGQSVYCMTAVGNVAMNRARQNLDKRYGRGLWGVINKRKQFSCLNKNDPNLKVIKRAMAGKLKPGTNDATKWKMAKDVAHILMHRSEADPTLGAVYYHATYMVPKWVKDRGMVRTVKLDGHIFYRKDN